MAEQLQGWRVVVMANVLPIVEPLIETVRGMGHDVVAWIMQRRPKALDLPPPPWGDIGDKTAPQGTNLIWARDKADLARLLRGLEPDVVLCWGFSWKIPQEALDVPRYGAVNQHPALLPRHRGPIPLSWALREGDDVFGITWHRMTPERERSSVARTEEQWRTGSAAPFVIADAADDRALGLVNLQFGDDAGQPELA